MANITRLTFTFVLVSILLSSCSKNEDAGRWSAQKAQKWYDNRDWIAGCNYIPSNAVNQLEMWQASSFDPTTINQELELANDIGFNTVRVFLHHTLWETDRRGFKKRIKQFLEIADSHGISTIFVFLDDCWNEEYHPGKQPEPVKGIHNSGWVKDPGAAYYGSKKTTVTDTAKITHTLESYVKDIIKEFKNDNRILAWDLYNEPGGGQGKDRYYERSFPLLKQIFGWARQVNPSQPLTAGVWSPRLSEMNVWQIKNSDILTYHTYGNEAEHSAMIDTLKKYGRPMICTEYMARTNDSRFQNIMPLLKKENIGAINWGFIAGKTNTIYEWTSEYGADEPEIWFHDIFRKDGTPFSTEEIDVIKSLTY